MARSDLAVRNAKARKKYKLSDSGCGNSIVGSRRNSSRSCWTEPTNGSFPGRRTQNSNVWYGSGLSGVSFGHLAQCHKQHIHLVNGVVVAHTNPNESAFIG